MKRESSLAVDFGTERIKVSYYDHTKSECMLWRLGRHERVFSPALFFASREGKILWGEDAMEMVRMDPGGTVSGLKRKLDSKTIRINKKKYTPQMLLSIMFKGILTRASDELPELKNRAADRVVLTTPADYSVEYTKLLVAAAKEAGFKEVETIQEPVAAAQLWIHDIGVDDTDVIVLDCGGGTVDWAFLQRKAEKFQVSAEFPPGGNNSVGGRDIDLAIMGWLHSEQKELFENIHTNDWQYAIRVAKEFYCRTGIANPVSVHSERIDIPIEVFDKIFSSVFIEKICDGFLPFVESIKKGSSQKPLTILLVGGSAQTRGLREQLETRSGCSTVWWERSEYATVLGAVTKNNLVKLSQASNVQSRPSTMPSAPQSGDNRELLLNEQKLFNLAQQGIAVLQKVEQPTNTMEAAWEKAVAEIAGSREPFRLAVLGDVKAGKSTLINAIAGEALAFVDVTEATAKECLYKKGNTREFKFKYSSGKEEICPPEQANQIISERRHDEEWLRTISHFECCSPTSNLGTFELWDTPGFGASGHNEQVVNEFFVKVTGAIWVFEASLLGNAAIVAPIMKLKKAGKRIVAVINRVDELDSPSEIEECVAFLEDSLGDYLDAIVPVSAYLACEDTFKGNSNQMLSDALTVVEDVIIANAEDDRNERIARAVGLGSVGLTMEVGSCRRKLADKLGLIEHVSKNFKAAKPHTLEIIKSAIDEEVDELFRAEERAFRAKINTKEDFSTSEANKMITLFNKETSIKSAWEIAAANVTSQMELRWRQVCSDAISMSESAVPTAIVVTNNVQDSSFFTDVDTSYDGSDGTLASVAVGGASVATLGTVAALSAAVTWPIMLVAAPIGFITKFVTDDIMRSSSPGAQINKIGQNELSDKAHFICEQKRNKIKQEMIRTFPAQLEQRLNSEIAGLIEQSKRSVIGDKSIAEVQTSIAELSAIEFKLLDLLRDTLGRYEDVQKYMPLHRPIRIPPGSDGTRLISLILSRADKRLDLYARDWNFSLSTILAQLSSDVKVRLIGTASSLDWRAVREKMIEAVGSWQGAWRGKVVVTNKGLPVSITHSIIITSADSLVAEDGLNGLGQSHVVLDDHPSGRISAEREFASLWEGNSYVHGHLSTHPF
ncbi:MAG: Hsp70 family protein [Victivallales bacterium]|nr:Hsp70 family protein [Victivallales bacterium]